MNWNLQVMYYIFSIIYSVPYRGIYLISVIYSEMRVCTVGDYLPVILIDQTQSCIEKISLNFNFANVTELSTLLTVVKKI